jgi:hypothetical protein
MIKDEWREGHIGNLDEYIAFKWEAIQTARLHTPPTKEDIDEFISAYSDSADDYDHEKGGRALVFYSDALYDSDTLYNTFVEALRGYEYNAFNLDTIHKLVDIFGDDAIYQPCRELSVAIYIHAAAFIGVDLTKLSATAAKEISFITPSLIRLWWD